MRTTETRRPPDDCPTYRSSSGPASGPARTARTAGPVRRSIFPKGACPAPTATFPVVTLQDAPGADWRGQAVTEELAAVPAPRRRNRPARRSACRHSVARRHLRAALIGTLLAIVAISGLSAYAAAGIADARSTALCQARITCK